MSDTKKPEVWLRGPVAGIPALLQPVAHALLQAREEVTEIMKEFPDELLWVRPAGMASAGFHLQHLAGVLDRLFTYAAGSMLSEEQLAYLKKEGQGSDVTASGWVLHFHQHVEKALAQLADTDESTLTHTRGVGRAQIPSTVIGLLFHAAEHTQRHTGQLLVTAAVVKQG
ncbi:MAG: DinB family protein [Chitinophagaceae bacterium]|nr:DinB family protein [Chitinophagaceae bacterium]